jgi:hypothetical protein
MSRFFDEMQYDTPQSFKRELEHITRNLESRGGEYRIVTLDLWVR